MEDEHWSTIQGFEAYDVSNVGRVRRKATGYILKPWRTSSNYLAVTLYISGKMLKRLVHRLVATAFIQNDNVQHKTTVNHIDYNRNNNRADNLEWATVQKQNLHSHAHTKKRKSLGPENPITCHTIDGRVVKKYESLTKASRDCGISIPRISNATINKTLVNGMRWCYDNLQDLEGEVWRTLSDFPLILISNKGRIESTHRNRRHYGYLKENGYCYVESISLTGDRKTLAVHRLVATAFLESPGDTTVLFVNHKDGNKSNNTVDNLEWVTPYQNNQYAVAYGLYVKVTQQICQKDVNGNLIHTYNSIAEATRIVEGRSGSSISACCRKKRKTAYGFHWEYVE